MPTQRLSMRRIREVLRLRHQGLTERVIARMLGVSNGVVHGYVRRARLAGLTWPLPEGLDDEGLELLLFPAPKAASQSDRRPSPDWVYVEKGATPAQRDTPAVVGRVSRRQSRRLWLYLVLHDLRGLEEARDRACGRPTRVERRCSSISPATPSTSSIPSPAKRTP